MLKYWVWLSELKGLRNQTKLALLRRFGDPESIFYADPDELSLTEGADLSQLKLLENHELAQADRILADCQRLDIGLLTFSDAAYPGRLKNIYDPPVLLYYKGKLPLLDDLMSVAVVGTRDCTPYGVNCAEKLGFGLASGGAVVVSGLAKGIDAAATRGALRAGGITIGVTGNGLDVHYPYESRYLYEDVAASGVLLSEYPPGTEPAPGHFPVRNRILSGLSLAALVVADSVFRLQPGVLACAEGYEDESFYSGLLEYPQYTRPEEWHGMRVPQVLLSGHHANIRAWRAQQALERTRQRRPDLYEAYRVGKKDGETNP